MPGKSSSGPPSLSLQMIRTLCRSDLLEELEGNLCEYYRELPAGPFKKLKYWYEALSYVRFSTIRSINTQISGSMFVFNPLLTFRNLLRHKATTLISLFGFTLGLVATIFLFHYVSGELATDQFHTQGEKIYRFLRTAEVNSDNYRIGVTSGPYAGGLVNDFPDAIAEVTRAMPESGLVTYEDRRFFEDHLLFADANFFEFFSFPLAVGDQSQVLQEVNSAVISREIATRYFGDEDPIGKEFTVDTQYDFVVTGILDDLPARSHLEFDMVLSIKVFERYEWFTTNWWNNALFTYGRIPSDEVAASIGPQLNEFMVKYMGDAFEASGNKMGLVIEPLPEIYFNSGTKFDFVRHGNMNSIYILIAVAIAILFIASFNYVNLSIAQSFMRAKEVGVRKVLGVNRKRLLLQFLGESSMILAVAFLIAMAISWLAVPSMSIFFELDLDPQWFDLQLWVFLGSLFLIILVISGAQPALLLSSFQPIQAMKGIKRAASNVSLRKGLVVLQFAISIFLIVATLMIGAQNQYLQTKDLGFTKEAVLVVDLNHRQIREEKETFKDRLLAHKDITKATMISGEPGGFHDASTFIVPGGIDNQRLRTVFTDVDYLDLFDIEVIAGRGYSEEITTDATERVLINRKGVEGFGLTPEQIINQPVDMPGWGFEDLKIIGVVENFHFSSLRDEIQPLAIITGTRHRKLALKVNTANIQETILFIEDVFKELSPEYPLSYDFLDDRIGRLYEQEQKQARVFTAFSGISILLACLGIFGLAAYSAQQRQKELGIRKVLGATPTQIIRLISREFLLLVAIAVVVATPVAWYFMEGWLGDFAYRIRMTEYWYIFLVGGAAAIGIALVTVSLKTFQAAISDPTQSIRNE